LKRITRPFSHLRVLIALLAPLAIAAAVIPNLSHYKALAKAIAPQAFTNPLAIPPVLTGSNITLEAREADVQLLPGATTRMWTYNGTFPGPTIRRPTGQTTNVTLVNNLSAAGSLSLHHHGAHTSSNSDGQPASLLVPVGQSRTYTYSGIEDNANERGALHWYHDHMMDMTGHNVWMGLAGMYIVDDPADPQTLPSGEFDVPLMVMDRSFNENNQLVYEFNQNGIEGDMMLVNGVVQPYFNVGTTKYRFRVLNASNFSDIDLELSNGQSLLQIGTESGLLPAPVARQHILLGPAERADIVVDFAGQLGQNIVLRNRVGSLGTAEIMQFHVNRELADSSTVPPTLRALPNLGTPVTTRTFEFGHTNGRWTINGQTFDVNRVDAQPVLGTTEKWILTNPLPGEWSHVIHIHLSNQQILSRNGAQPGPYELMKESWYLNPGDTIELLIKFTDYTGRFVFHCHILEHEDDSMMGQFEVVTTPPPATATPAASATRTSTPTPTRTAGITPTSQCATPTPTTAAVSIVNFAFNPQTTTITQGSSVRWTNTANRTHTSASDTGVWNSGNIASGASFTRVFTTIGSFPFHCNIHPAMTGVINVIAAPCATNTPTNTASATSTSTSTSTSIASSTKTATQTSLPSTSTVQPTNVPVSPTSSPLPPSATSTATSTQTNTVVASSTPANTVGATATATDIPTFTFTPTYTRTNTPTATNTSTGTLIPTGTSTGIPTGTPTNSPTYTHTNTSTAVAGATRTPLMSTGTPVEPTSTSTQESSPTVCAVQFEDVPMTDTFYSFIRCLACRGIISGYSDGTFRPGTSLTRGQAAKILSNAAGFTEPVPLTQQTFSDVPVESTFWVYIERLYQRGVMSGYTCGDPGEPCPGTYYRPQNNITREQFAKLDANVAGYVDTVPSTQQTFNDVPSTSIFWIYVERVALHNVLSGYECGAEGEPCPGAYFRPRMNVTRGQASKIITNTFFTACQARLKTAP
jgi:spore coat protein A